MVRRSPADVKKPRRTERVRMSFIPRYPYSDSTECSNSPESRLLVSACVKQTLKEEETPGSHFPPTNEQMLAYKPFHTERPSSRPLSYTQKARESRGSAGNMQLCGYDVIDFSCNVWKLRHAKRLESAQKVPCCVEY